MKINGLENLVDFCVINNYDFSYIDIYNLNSDEIAYLLSLNITSLDVYLVPIIKDSSHIDILLSRNILDISNRLSVYMDVFTDEQFDNLLSFNNTYIHNNLARKNLTYNQIQKMFNIIGYSKISLFKNENISLELKQKIINDTLKENVFK